MCRRHFFIGRISELGCKNKIDNITGLYREVRLRQDILKMDRASAKKGFLLLIGIDNFKDINERYNKEVGNSTLQVLAQCITEAVGESASVYRMSGDEIMVFCKGLDSILSDPAKEMYKKIRSVVDKKINEKGYRLFYTISGGSVYFTEEDNTGIQYI